MKILTSVVISLLLQAASAQQPASIAMAGRVLKTGTAESIARATVELRTVPADAVQYQVTTMDDGRFTFTAVKPGQYRIAVSASGYVSTEYGRRKPSARGTPLDVAAPLRDVQIAMTPTGVISGRVIDNTGHAVVNAEVQAMKASYQDGRRVLTPIQSAVTDDLGEYRLFWLTPGSYFVGAIGPIWGTTNAVQIVIGPGAPVTGLSGYGGGNGGYNPLAPASLPDDRRDPSARYQNVYYPNTVDDQAAQPVEVGPGGEANANIVFSSFIRTRHLRILVTDETNGPAPNQIRLGYLPGVQGAPAFQRYSPAGEYQTEISTAATVLTVSSPAAPPAPTAPAVPLRMGRVRIPEGESDLDVPILLKLGKPLAGRVVVESSEANAPKPSAFRMALVTEPRGLLQPFVLQADGSVAGNGSFILPNVSDGDYRLNITPILNMTAATPSIPAALQHAYVKSIRFGDTDVLNGAFHIPGPPDAALSIVIANNAGTLTGTAMNDKQEPDADSTVVLVPANRSRTDLYRSATTDPAGRFKLDRIPPGDYKLFAWDEIEPGAWQDAQLLQPFENRGIPIQISEGSTMDIKVVVIPQL